MSEVGDELIDFDGPEGSDYVDPRVPAGTTDGAVTGMEVDEGKLTKSAKKRLKKKAAKTAAKPAFVTPDWIAHQIASPVQRQVAKKKSKSKKRIQAVADAEDTAVDTAAAELTRDAEAPVATPAAAAAKPPAPRGSPEQRKQAVEGRMKIKLKRTLTAKADDARAQLEAVTAKLQASEKNNRDLHALLQTIADRLDKVEAERDARQQDIRDASMSTAPTTDPVDTPTTGTSTDRRATPATAAAVSDATQGRPSTATYSAAAARGHELAELQRKLAESEDTCRLMIEQRDVAERKLQDMESRLLAFESKTFLQALNKPSTFTGAKVKGKPNLSVRDWIMSVKDYADSLQLSSDRLRVTVAESYLGGDAKRDWHTKRKVMQDSGVDITFASFTEAVIDSWDPACSDVKARMQLEQHRYLGNMTAYVSRFDRLCSFIPKMNADERVHKFLYQLQITHPRIAQDLQTDPATKERWTDYHALRKYALHTAVNDAYNDTPSQPKTDAKSKPRFADRKRRAGDLQGALDRHKRRKGVFEGRLEGTEGGTAAGGSAGGNWIFNKPSGEKRWRSAEEMAALSDTKTGRKCAWCWGVSSKQHHAHTCTKTFKRDPPAAN